VYLTWDIIGVVLQKEWVGDVHYPGVVVIESEYSVAGRKGGEERGKDGEESKGLRTDRMEGWKEWRGGKYT
jgi:hypothetical protein